MPPTDPSLESLSSSPSFLSSPPPQTAQLNSPLQPTRLLEFALSEISVERRIRRSIGPIDDLVASIAEVGLLQPLVLTPAGRLVSGERRLEALRRLGVKRAMCAIAETLPDAWALVAAEVQENTCRKPFSPSAAARAAEELLPFASAAARSRQEGSDEHENPDSGGSGRALDHVAKIVGMSLNTVQRAIQVIEAAREDPATYQDLVQRMDAAGKVNGAYLEMLARRKPPSHIRPTKGCTIRMDKDGRLTVIGSPAKRTLIAGLNALIADLEAELAAISANNK